jgi:hypothetical protein
VMSSQEGPIRRLYSKLSGSAPASSTPSPRVAAAEEPQVRETICAPKPMPKRCLNEGGHKALR